MVQGIFFEFGIVEDDDVTEEKKWWLWLNKQK